MEDKPYYGHGQDHISYSVENTDTGISSVLCLAGVR